MIARNRICNNKDDFRKARVVTFLNPYSFLKLSEAKIELNQFDKICIDGVALKVFLSLVYRCRNIERLSFDFTSVAQLVFEDAVADKTRGFILGSDENSNTQFLAKITEMYPGIELSGRSGYFDSAKDQTEYLKSLASSDYDFVVVGMGAVKQEQAAVAIVESGFKGRVYTCGGFIHQTALGGGHYYPAWVNKMNLRFAYRMFKEPSTIRRYLIDYPKAFVCLTCNIGKFKY